MRSWAKLRFSLERDRALLPSACRAPPRLTKELSMHIPAHRDWCCHRLYIRFLHENFPDEVAELLQLRLGQMLTTTNLVQPAVYVGHGGTHHTGHAVKSDECGERRGALLRLRLRRRSDLSQCDTAMPSTAR